MEKNEKNMILQKIGRVAFRFSVILLITVILIAGALYTAMFVLVNGPSPTVGKLFVLSLKETSAGGFLAHWFMSDSEIETLLAEKAIEESSEINTALIKLPEKILEDDNTTTTDELQGGTDTGEEKKENERLRGIEIHNVSGGTYNGKLLIVKDPRRVFVGVPDRYGEDAKGLSLSAMINKYDAIGGTNAGGFIDPNGSGTGGIPEGIVISEGKLLWGDMNSSYSLAGLDENGLLYVGKMTGARAMELGLCYAVSYGPALIINGEPCNANRSLGGGINPRTAIGQREDGAILLLVINGRQIDSLGATLDDLIEVMLSFGAVNASNLDGGSSSLMKLDGEYLNTSSYILGGERVLASTILID